MSLTTTLLIGAGVIAAATAAAYLLPAKVTVTRSATVAATPGDILALAASNTGYQAFNPYKEADPHLQITHFGPEAGVGSGFRFEGKDGKGTQTVAEVSDTHVTYDIDMGPMGKPRQTITVRAIDGGSEVTWRMDADMGANPVFRVVGLFMDGMMGKIFDKGLANLAKATA
ncbi:MAG: SRPBCC family protein [Pseudomonadota bacterium]